MRLARRELARRPRDAALVVALVALPVAIVMAVGVVIASGHPTRAELEASELGTTEAWVQGVGPAGSTVMQGANDPDFVSTSGGDEDDTSDVSLRDPVKWLPAGARVIPIETYDEVVSASEAAAHLTVMLGPMWSPAFTGSVAIYGGGTPSASDEVMVSPALAQRFDLKIGDELTIGDNLTVTAVGIMGPIHGWDDGVVYGTEALEAELDSGRIAWFVESPSLDAQAVDALRSDGFAVFARGVTGGAELSAPNDAAAVGGIVVGVGLGLIEIVLLAGAAFAVSMRRRQHTLALVAATGAERRELVGVGLASGMWHGVAAGVIGVPLGLLAAWLWLRVLVTIGGPQGRNGVWGFHAVWWHMLVAFGFGVLAAALASLVPALRTSGVDVMAALRGSQRPRTARAWPAVVGGVVLAAGLAALVVAAHLTDAALDLPQVQAGSARLVASVVLLVGVAATFTGAAMTLPLVFGWLAQLSGVLGVAPRIAARDAARNAGRTVPVVVAIAITVVLGVGLFLGEARSDVAWQRAVSLDSPVGTGLVYMTTSDADGNTTYADPNEIAKKLSAVLPQATFAPLNIWQDPWTGESAGVTYSVSVPKHNVCVAYQGQPDGPALDVSQREISLDKNCESGIGTDVYGVATGDATLLETLLGHAPTDAAVKALNSGGMVIFTPQLADGDTVTVTASEGDQAKGSFTLPAVVDEPDVRLSNVFAMISPSTALAKGISTNPNYLLVSTPGGLTQADEDAANGALVRDDLFLGRSRLPSSDDGVVAAIALIAIAVVALAATGLALGLARADARRDDFTLASLGASPALAKRVSGWQATLTVFVALALGIGTAVAMDWVRSHELLTAPFAPPWLALVGVLVLLPAAIGLVAGLVTRAPKAVHFRLAA